MAIRGRAARLRQRRMNRASVQVETSAGSRAGGRVDIDGQVPVSGDDAIDVRELLGRYTVEELSVAADDYYRKSLDSVDYYLAKPATTVDEAPELLISFAQILSGVRPVRGMRVLDFGAGTGWTSRFLAQLGCQVVVCDVSETALDIARQLFERQPLAGDQPAPEFLLFDGRRIDLPDESVDRIICCDSLHHVPNLEAVLAELGRVLRQGGVGGFQEPGPNHSKSSQSQFEMKTFTVIENDILMRDVDRWAAQAGFTKLELAVFTAHPYHTSIDGYEDFLSDPAAAGSYAEHVRAFAADRRIFFLTKGTLAMSDSRDRTGLLAKLTVIPSGPTARAGGSLPVRLIAENVGTALWLPSDAPAGQVLVGVHLLGGDGTLLDRDYSRIPLPRSGTGAGVAPGEQVEFDAAIPVPAEPGDYEIKLDLVAEYVCWFEVNGCAPATFRLTAT